MAKQLEGLLEAVQCSLCEGLFQNPHTFKGCGHTFCLQCVLQTLEGPGIAKSECPTCKQPAWKKDLVFNHQINNVVGHITDLSSHVRRGPGLRQRMQSRQTLSEAGTQQPGGGATPAEGRQPAAPTAALSEGAPRASVQQSAQAKSVGRAKRGASAPAVGQPAQALQLPAAAGMPDTQRQRDKGTRQAGQQALQASPSSATANGPEAIHEEALPCFDEAWAQRMLALPNISPVLVVRLLQEVALLDQAIRLCDELPCLGEQGQQQQQRRRWRQQKSQRQQQLGSTGPGGPTASWLGGQQLGAGPGEEQAGASAGPNGAGQRPGSNAKQSGTGASGEAEASLSGELPQSLASVPCRAEAGLSQELPCALAAAPAATAHVVAGQAAQPGSGGLSQELPIALAGQPSPPVPSLAAGDLPCLSRRQGRHEVEPLAAAKPAAAAAAAAAVLAAPDFEDSSPVLLPRHRQLSAGAQAAAPSAPQLQVARPRGCEGHAEPAGEQGLGSPSRAGAGTVGIAAGGQLHGKGGLVAAAAVIADSPDAERTALGPGRQPAGVAEGGRLLAIDLREQLWGSLRLTDEDNNETRPSGRKRRKGHSGRATPTTSAAQTSSAGAAADGAGAQAQAATAAAAAAAAAPIGSLPLARQPSRLALQQQQPQPQQAGHAVRTDAQCSGAGPALPGAAVEAIADSDDEVFPLPAQAGAASPSSLNAEAASAAAGSYPDAGSDGGFVAGAAKGAAAQSPAAVPGPPPALAAEAATAVAPALPAWHKRGVKQPTWKRQKLEQDMAQAEKFVGGFRDNGAGHRQHQPALQPQGQQQQQQQPEQQPPEQQQQQQQEWSVGIGSRVRVRWEEGYFEGTITKFRPETGEHFIVYADGDREWHNLDEEQWELLRPQQQQAQQRLGQNRIYLSLPSCSGDSDQDGSADIMDRDSPLSDSSAGASRRHAARGRQRREQQRVDRPAKDRAQLRQAVISSDSESSEEEDEGGDGGLQEGAQPAAVAGGEAAGAQAAAAAEEALPELEACPGQALQLGTEDAASLLADLACDSGAAGLLPGEPAASKPGLDGGGANSTHAHFPAGGNRQQQQQQQPQLGPGVVQFKRRGKQPPPAAAAAASAAPAALRATSRHNVLQPPGRLLSNSQLTGAAAGGMAAPGSISCQEAVPGCAGGGQQGGSASPEALEGQAAAQRGLRDTSGGSEQLQQPQEETKQEGVLGELPASAGKASEQHQQQQEMEGQERDDGSLNQGPAAGPKGEGSLGAAASAASVGLTSVMDLFAAQGGSGRCKGPAPRPAPWGPPVEAPQASQGSGDPVRVLVPSYLSSQNQSHVLECIQKLRGGGKAVLEDSVTERTTHVLVPTDDAGVATTRTIKYLMGVAAGCWVVSYAWLDACMEAKAWVSERAFEVRGDPHGAGAAVKSRVERSSGREGLFHGITAYVYNPTSSNGANLAQMLEFGGAKVLTRLPPSQDIKRLRIFLPGSVKDNKKAAQDIKARTGSKQVLSWEWVFDSLSSWRIMPHKPTYLY